MKWCNYRTVDNKGMSNGYPLNGYSEKGEISVCWRRFHGPTGGRIRKEV